jgi:hypothetical protein
MLPVVAARYRLTPNTPSITDDERILIRNYEGAIYEYPEARDGTPKMPAPKVIEEPELV